MKRNFKIILDIVMLLAALTLYSKQFISMNYHEISGLVLIGLVIVHIVINIKTILAMTKKFMKVPLAMKVGLIVDILLIICFGWLGVSGIFISKTILTSISSTNMIFKMTHMFFGALSVVLLGIHVGLHICRKPMPMKISVIASIIIFACGIYGVIQSSELRWLSMPFMATSQAQGGMKGNGEGPGMGGHENGMMRGERPDKGEQGNAQEGSENWGNRGNKGESSDSEINEGNFQGKPNKGDFPDRPSEGNFEGKGVNKQSSSIVQKIQTVVMFLGMILSFSMITYWIVVLKKKKQSMVQSENKDDEEETEDENIIENNQENNNENNEEKKENEVTLEKDEK